MPGVYWSWLTEYSQWTTMKEIKGVRLYFADCRGVVMQTFGVALVIIMGLRCLCIYNYFVSVSVPMMGLVLF